jgi:hypothetical protein
MTFASDWLVLRFDPAVLMRGYHGLFRQLAERSENDCKRPWQIWTGCWTIHHRSSASGEQRWRLLWGRTASVGFLSQQRTKVQVFRTEMYRPCDPLSQMACLTVVDLAFAALQKDWQRAHPMAVRTCRLWGESQTYQALRWMDPHYALSSFSYSKIVGGPRRNP